MRNKYRIHFRKVDDKWQILSIANISGQKSVILLGTSRKYRKGDIIFDNSHYDKTMWYLKINSDNPDITPNRYKIDNHWLRVGDSIETKLRKLIEQYNYDADIVIDDI